MTVDRSTLEEYEKPLEDFVPALIEKLDCLRPHAFIASQQSSFFYHQLENLQPGTMLIGGDFAENYAFIVQDSSQEILC